MQSKEYRKIFFTLDVDEDNYPPVGVESLNAEVLGENKFRIDNTPFFVDSISLGDVVTGTLINDSDKRYWYNKTVSISNNISLSIIFIDESYIEQVVAKLKESNCYCEHGKFGTMSMLAVSVLDNHQYPLISRYLEQLESKDILSYAELAI